MRIEVMDYKKTKSEAKKYISKKLPLASKVAQFNSFIENLHVEYIEFKILKYEIVMKKKNSMRREIDRETINIIVNTCNGRSESISQIPKTAKKYVAKSYIRKNNIDEDQLTIAVKEEVIRHLNRKIQLKHKSYYSIHSIDLIEIKSIYKACWIAEFRGRNILIDME